MSLEEGRAKEAAQKIVDAEKPAEADAIIEAAVVEYTKRGVQAGYALRVNDEKLRPTYPLGKVLEALGQVAHARQSPAGVVTLDREKLENLAVHLELALRHLANPLLICHGGDPEECRGPMYQNDGGWMCERHLWRLQMLAGERPGAAGMSRAEYEEAIAALEQGKTQLKPDGHCCAICGDSGHQAFECSHNPLVQMRRYRQISAVAIDLHEKLHETIGWRT